MARIRIDEPLHVPEADDEASFGIPFDEDDVDSMRSALDALGTVDRAGSHSVHGAMDWLRDRIERHRAFARPMRRRAAGGSRTLDRAFDWVRNVWSPSLRI